MDARTIDLWEKTRILRGVRSQRAEREEEEEEEEEEDGKKEEGEGERAATSRLEVFRRDIKAGISNGAKAIVNEVLVWPFSSRDPLSSSSSSSSSLSSSLSIRYVPVRLPGGPFIASCPETTYAVNRRVSFEQNRPLDDHRATLSRSFSFDHAPDV